MHAPPAARPRRPNPPAVPGSRPAGVLVAAALLALLAGLAAGAGGIVAVFAHATGRDASGFYRTTTLRLGTPTYALTSSDLDLTTEGGGPGWAPSDRRSTTVRLRAGLLDGRPVFVGIASADDVEAYLDGTAHDAVADLDVAPPAVDYRRAPGDDRPVPPATAGFWAAAASGRGTQTVTWPVEKGRWQLVVMNADGSPGITADVSTGVRTAILLDIGLALLATALLALAAGATVLFVALRPGPEGDPVVGDDRAEPVGAGRVAA